MAVLYTCSHSSGPDSGGWSECGAVDDDAGRQSSVGLLRLGIFLPRPRPVARRPGVESGLFVVRACGSGDAIRPVRASSRASTRPPESFHRGARSNWPAPRWPLASGWRTSSPATCPPARPSSSPSPLPRSSYKHYPPSVVFFPGKPKTSSLHRTKHGQFELHFRQHVIPKRIHPSLILPIDPTCGSRPRNRV